MNNAKFKTDLTYGQKRELDLVTLLPQFGLVPSNGLLEDFVDKNGDKWELKAERRKSTETPNIAVEVISSFKRQGAIYNAFKNGVRFLCYLFADNAYFIYDCIKIYYIAKRSMRQNGTIAVWNSKAQIVLLNRRRIKCLQIF